MSGGKGGSQDTETKIPDWAKEPTIRKPSACGGGPTDWLSAIYGPRPCGV